MHAGTAHRQPSRSKIGSRRRGPSLPLGRRVAQKPLEALPRWRASRSERADRGPEERHDGGGSVEEHVRVAAARTHLPLFERGRDERPVGRRWQQRIAGLPGLERGRGASGPCARRRRGAPAHSQGATGNPKRGGGEGRRRGGGPSGSRSAEAHAPPPAGARRAGTAWSASDLSRSTASGSASATASHPATGIAPVAGPPISAGRVGGGGRLSLRDGVGRREPLGRDHLRRPPRREPIAAGAAGEAA